MSTRKVKIGIIGSGGYGGSARRYIRNTKKFDIVACMDVNKDVAKKAACEDGAIPYTDLDTMLDHHNLEAVSINTPVLLHGEHSVKSLNAGKHVFITKPITNNVKEAIEIKKLAKKKRLAYMVGFHARHTPEAKFLKELLLGGKLGTVCNGIATCCSSAGLEQTKKDWRVIPGQNPGGPMLQCGIHTIDKLLGIFGPITKVMSMMQEKITPFDVADNTLTLLQFKCGVQVTFVSNYTTAYMHTLDFFGTKANLHSYEHITGLGQHEMYLQPRAKGAHEAWQALRIPTVKGNYPDPHGGVLEKEFAKQIISNKITYDNLDDAIQALKIIEAAVESHKTGKAVTIKP